ncbi:LysR family transcriptional regulator [Sphingomonas quercus]|uniref:LysR family transcriptional regulator n=1 Tax=Sphingomonas quercus TaxID=2842451 RepID=A0ABS6BHK9_9SPHN|nr:LysR family transcriptional regulator [Sphingomonas quercus]MBU3077788.1 LysR family transcriptional regulator [Sphingomonas quercus]
MPHLPDFEAWAIFAKVAERGSFSQAADELGLAKTTVSKSISRLETKMRTTLIHRTTRKLSLTESGRLSLDRALRILADGAAIEADILEEAAVPRGQLRVASTTGFGLEALAPALPEFMEAYPEIELELCLTEDRVDLIADGWDLAIQIGGNIDSSLRISRLFSLRRPLVAAPSFLQRHGVPGHPSELAEYRVIIPTHVPWSSNWEFTHNITGEVAHVHVGGGLRVNNAAAMLPALKAGLGITLMPEFFVWEEIEAGALSLVLADWTVPPGPICVVTPPGRARPARVRVFLEFLREHFSSQPWARGVER